MALRFFQQDLQELQVLPEYLTNHELSNLSQCCRTTRDYQKLFRANGHSPSMTWRYKPFCHRRKRFHRFIQRQTNLKKLRADYKDLRTAKPEVWRAMSFVNELEINMTWDTKIGFLVEEMQSGCFPSLERIVDHSYLSSGELVFHLPTPNKLRHLHIHETIKPNRQSHLAQVIMQGDMRLESLHLRECNMELMVSIVQHLGKSLKLFHCKRMHGNAFRLCITSLGNGCFPVLEDLYLFNIFMEETFDMAEDEELMDPNFSKVIDALIDRHLLGNQTPLRFLKLLPEVDTNDFLHLIQSPIMPFLENFAIPLSIYKDFWNDESDHPDYHILCKAVREIDLSNVKHLSARYNVNEECHLQSIYRSLFSNPSLRSLVHLDFHGVLDDIRECLQSNNVLLRSLHINLDEMRSFENVSLPSIQELKLITKHRWKASYFLRDASLPILRRVHVKIISRFAYYEDKSEDHDEDEEEDVLYNVLLQKSIDTPYLRNVKIDDINIHFEEDLVWKNKTFRKLQSLLHNRQ